MSFNFFTYLIAPVQTAGNQRFAIPWESFTPVPLRTPFLSFPPTEDWDCKSLIPCGLHRSLSFANQRFAYPEGVRRRALQYGGLDYQLYKPFTSFCQLVLFLSSYLRSTEKGYTKAKICKPFVFLFLQLRPSYGRSPKKEKDVKALQQERGNKM